MLETLLGLVMRTVLKVGSYEFELDQWHEGSPMWVHLNVKSDAGYNSMNLSFSEPGDVRILASWLNEAVRQLRDEK